MATLSVAARSKHPDLSLGNARAAVRTYTGPASYATGGDSLVAREVKLSHIHDVWATLAVNAAGTVRLLLYDAANGTVLWYVPNTGAEVANGTDLSGYTAQILVLEG